jgi:hypothetical protein
MAAVGCKQKRPARTHGSRRLLFGSIADQTEVASGRLSAFLFQGHGEDVVALNAGFPLTVAAWALENDDLAGGRRRTEELRVGLGE